MGTSGRKTKIKGRVREAKQVCQQCVKPREDWDSLLSPEEKEFTAKVKSTVPLDSFEPKLVKVIIDSLRGVNGEKEEKS